MNRQSDDQTQNDIKRWYEGDFDEESDEYSLAGYDITQSPNDFNVRTIFDYIERGVISVPGFQRNYVWDIKKASALIESLILGLPIPQIFLYQESPSKFIVVDGQQRLMSLYYFLKRRFPHINKRPQLRRIIEQQIVLPESILADDAYFATFDLKLPPRINGPQNPYNGKNYATLGDAAQTTLDLRTIRSVVIRQNVPADDDSSIYEIFSRLNTSGVVLTGQEIRTALYHSDFYRMLDRINTNDTWRKLLDLSEPDLHFKDLEFLLRGMAMLQRGDLYRPSMRRFLNLYSKECRTMTADDVAFLELLFRNFVDRVMEADPKAFVGRTRQFNISIFESVFTAVCSRPLATKTSDISEISASQINALKADAEFQKASQSRTAGKAEVAARLSKAREYLMADAR
jgi:hypothetical protein